MVLKLNCEAKTVSQKSWTSLQPPAEQGTVRTSSWPGCVLLHKEHDLQEWHVLSSQARPSSGELPCTGFPPASLRPASVHVTSFKTLQKLEMTIGRQLSKWLRNHSTESYSHPKNSPPCKQKKLEKH